LKIENFVTCVTGSFFGIEFETLLAQEWLMSKHVLVVDDDEVVRNLVIERLAQHDGIRVDSARDGVEALHKLASRQYSIILLDIVMPKMTGVDFLRSLRAMIDDPSLKSPPRQPAVLVMTSTAPSELPNEALHHYGGLVRGVFRKPMDFSELLARVEELMAGQPG